MDEKWINIKYDYVLKYYTTCMIQGHDKEQCYVLHPKLYPERKDNKEKEGEKQEKNS